MNDKNCIVHSKSLPLPHTSMLLSPSDVHSILFSFSVLKIGFVSPVYSASEGLANVTVCIEVKEGSLSITPNLSLSTYNHTAGICLHMIHDS